MRVLMTGGTGTIGRVLASALTARGDEVAIVSRGVRSGPEAREFFAGDPAQAGDWMVRVAGRDVVIHLAGAPLVRFAWDERTRRKIRTSRVEATRHLVAAIAEAPPERRPRALLCASSADVYAFDASDARITETAPAGDHFAASVFAEVEAAAEAASALGVKVAALRLGHVIGTSRDDLERFTGPFSLFYRGAIGTGEQWLSWIHIDDVVAACSWITDQSLAGPFNLVAPGDIRQGDLARMVSACLKREPQVLSVAKIVNAYREMGEVVVNGRRVIPKALVASGFRFRRPDAASALAATLADNL